MPAGRPTKFDSTMTGKARAYLATWNLIRDPAQPDNPDAWMIDPDSTAPCIEGLSLALHVSRSRIYEWLERKDEGDYEGITEFQDIVGEVLCKEAEILKRMGLKGAFNSSITKLLLSKHGYRDGIDVTTKDKELNGASVTPMTDKAQAAVVAYNEAMREAMTSKQDA